MGTGVSVSSHVAKPANQHLQPLLTTLRKTAVSDIFPAAQTKATRLTNTSYSPSIGTAGNDVYITLAAKDYAPGDYVGFSLPKATLLSEIFAADTLCRNNCVLISKDGRNWSQLLPTGNDVKHPEGYVKFVIVANNSTEHRSVKLTKSVLRATLHEAPALTGINAPVDRDYNDRGNISDGDLTTFWCPYADQQTGDIIRLNYSAAAPLRRVRFALHTTNGDYMKTGRIECSEDGTTWKRLSPEDTKKTSFTLNDMTPVDDAGNALPSADGAYIYQLYFDGASQNTRYVRFFNQVATPNKWIRIAEFTPEFAIEDLPNTVSPEICDNLPHTGCDVSETFYIFKEFMPLNGVTIYGNENCKGVKVYGWNEPDEVNGEHNYMEIGTLSGGVSYIDLTAWPYLRHLWLEGEDGAQFRIYEVVPDVSDDVPSLNDITAIEQIMVTTPEEAGGKPVMYDLSGRKVSGEARGCYIAGGKKIMK